MNAFGIIVGMHIMEGFLPVEWAGFCKNHGYWKSGRKCNKVIYCQPNFPCPEARKN